jgi:eukaryotic-like serine/threonine-protein kinase
VSVTTTGWIVRTATSRTLPVPQLPAPRDEVLEAIVHPSRLPALPAIAAKVAEVVARPKCMPAELTSLIATDPAFSAALLQAVNTAREGTARNVGTVDRAVLLVGLNRVRALALSLALPPMRQQSRFVAAALDHSLSSVGGAIFARELAALRGYPEPEEDLNAALLRDIGVLLIQQTYPKEWGELAARGGDPLGEQACAREREVFGVDHAEVSAIVLTRWGLPPDVVVPILHHHHPERAAGTGHERRAELLWFAGLLTRLESVVEHPEALDRALAVAHKKFGLSVAALADFLASVRPKIDVFAESLNREIGLCPDYAGLLTTAMHELGRIAPAVRR